MKPAREMTYVQAINEALHEAMSADSSVVCFGLGVDDPKAIFGSTRGLQEKFGSARVFDMPTSENAMTGIAIGASLNGIRPVMVHQRLDFFLLAMDQLVNNAAKWFYTFGRPVPITIRLILGRGWGQGPTHSQSLHAWFAHIPGLKVVMPTSAADAKGLLLASIFDDNPVLFLEHRWLHETVGDVPPGNAATPLSKARVLQEGSDLTLVALSYMVVEALHAVELLARHGVQCELIDPRTVSPMDWETIFRSVKKTGRLLVLDTGALTGSVAGEIVARAATDCWTDLRAAPMRIAMPDVPEPASFELTRGFHPRAEQVVEAVNTLLGTEIEVEALLTARSHPHDVPGDWFRGPF
jgi:acetoin:2,6-dichlorophenolindophenol oxidoreductase subunit beta